MADIDKPTAPQEAGDEFEEAADKAPPDDFDRTLIREDAGAGAGVEEKTPASTAPLPYVVVIQGPRTGTRFPLAEDTTIVGRSPTCVVRLDDQSVSRQHSEFARAAGGWIVKDLGSKNGTFVNGSPAAEPVVIGHMDIVKVGIYLLRLVTQRISLAEEMKLPAELAGADETVHTEIQPSDGITGSVNKREEELVEAERKPPVDDEKSSEGVRPPAMALIMARLRKYLAPIGLGVIVLVAGAYLAQRFIAKPKAPVPTKAEIAARDDAKRVLQRKRLEQAKRAQEEGQPQQPGEVPEPSAALPVPDGMPVSEVPATPEAPMAAVPAEPTVPAVTSMPVFLDFASSPLPATIMFQGRELGRAPLRVNLELEPNRTYEAEGVFVLPEFNERYVQRVAFSATPDRPIVPLLFRGPIGILKIDELPRDVQFYLEGRFEYDVHNERPAKLSEIVLRKPIYIPFGKYMMELRRSRRLGASETYVQDIVFRRDFMLSADNPSFVLAITDEDLKNFPVVVRSEPPNADVYIDGKKVGTTPYEGLFPLGEHTMTIRKEGYFEYSEDLKVSINAPFQTTVTLQTSVAGAHINNAIAALNRAMYPQAINELAEALGSNPAPGESAKAHHLLGLAYLNMNDMQRALGYFDVASKHADTKHAAYIGMVRAYAAAGQVDQALPLLVDVLLNAKDSAVKTDANTVFQQISPFRSIVYIYSTPEGASVMVNDRPVAQTTPVILHDLPLGAYRVRIEKTGYLPQELRLNLSINEFNPVIVTLKPIPQ